MSNAANTVQMNGQPCEVRPLNWKQLKEYRKEIILLNGLDPRKGMFTEEEQEAILKVVTASLSRAQPSLTPEYVEQHLDLGNVGTILRLCFGQTSGTGEGTGEAQAATSQS